ncbi:hypothetical protein VPNG_02529 [Cytospora leucostoma]|uniref:Uncharacterized protein n=1 Tax=Cytospora leucostoma TaxID=1230097 RepID=A0A423XI62_9PEZI|nr:hypothetical protein VPNG_02529 [Cytospora leucostoma]
MPYMLASSVVVISTERAQRKQRIISMEATGRSRLDRNGESWKVVLNPSWL